MTALPGLRKSGEAAERYCFIFLCMFFMSPSCVPVSCHMYFAMRNIPGQGQIQYPITGAIDPFDAMAKSEKAWIDFQASASLRTPPTAQELQAMSARRPA
jgi:hypothetical protein